MLKNYLTTTAPYNATMKFIYTKMASIIPHRNRIMVAGKNWKTSFIQAGQEQKQW
jgi:hypothetical protein